MSCDLHGARKLERAKFIQGMAQDIRLKSSLRLLKETALAWDSTESELEGTLDLLEESLRAGTTISKPQLCDPDDCHGCFFFFMCSNWNYLQGLATDLIFKAEMDELDAKKEAERQKKLHTPQTFNAEWLNKVNEEKAGANREHIDSIALSRKSDLIIAETKDLLDRKMTPQKQEQYDKALGRYSKPKSTGQVHVAHDDWHLTEDQKRRKRLMGYPE